MLLRTLGGLVLAGSDFARPKPLLLLAYLALEGPQDRRYLAELFWPRASDHLKSLTVALSQLRQGVPGAIKADDKQVHALIDTDAKAFLAQLEQTIGGILQRTGLSRVELEVAWEAHSVAGPVKAALDRKVKCFTSITTHRRGWSLTRKIADGSVELKAFEHHQQISTGQ